jgi:hypothetical protein
MEDDEEPPALVDLTEVQDSTSRAEDKLAVPDTTGLKVPITIVTGMADKSTMMFSTFVESR